MSLMNREQRRATQRRVNKRYGKENMQNIINNIDEKLIYAEVDRKCEIYRQDMINCMVESMKKCGLDNMKVKRILDEFEIALRKKVLGVEK